MRLREITEKSKVRRFVLVDFFVELVETDVHEEVVGPLAGATAFCMLFACL